MNVRTLCLGTAFLVALPTAFAGTFVLNANAECFNVNNGSSFVGDFKTATFTAPGSASISSHSSMTGIEAYMNVSATMADEFHGSLDYRDGWRSTNLTSGQVRFFMTSSIYSFDTATDAVVDIVWNSSVISGGDTQDSFGLFDIHVNIDGVLFHPADVWPPTPSGHWTMAVGAGSHTLEFWDQSNLFGQFGTRNDEITEHLDFSITPVPEPASFLAVALGLAALKRRR